MLNLYYFVKEIFLVINCTKASGSSGDFYFTRVSELFHKLEQT